MKRFRLVLLLLLLFVEKAATAQNWHWKAPVEPMPRTEYYNIFLPAEMTSKLNPVYGNLRLLTEKGEEVPFLFFSEDHVDQQVKLKWYTRIRKDDYRRWYSKSFFSNPKANVIDRMVLKVRNADVRQSFWLSGSDDMNHWYIIKEDFAYDANFDANSSYSLLTLDFPPVNYKYYKVEIRHRWREPIQIMGAGYYVITETEGNYQHVPPPEIKQQENQRKSEVTIHFDGRHYIDRLFFEIDGPEMYLRQAELQQKVGNQYRTLERFALSSRELNLLVFDALRAQDLRLVIDNRDDQALRVAAVQALQLRKYLTAKLEKDSAYTLHIGQEGLRTAEYDLRYFEADLPPRRSAVRMNQLIDVRPDTPDQVQVTREAPPATPLELPAQPQMDPVDSDKDRQQWYLWGGIILIIVLLGGMAFRMLRDMGEPEDPA